MKIKRVFPLILVMLLPGIFLESCKKEEQEYTSNNLVITFPQLELKHDLYYLISSFDRSIEIEFNETLDSSSVPGNIHFSDKSGSLDVFIEVMVFGRSVLVIFDSDFVLKAGWQYFLTINQGVISASGENFPLDINFELRTMGIHPDMPGSIVPGNSTTRTSIVVVSDIHMGDARANTLKYCWFGDNNTALLDLLDFIESGNEVKQVVILGDLFDEWVIPYSINPFDPQTGISNAREYFHAIADNPVNQLIFAKFKDIASHQEIDLIYVHGNHDMRLTNEVLQEIIPGTIWKSDTMGLGKYLPVPQIVMEHGHRYDFFNCPQPLVNTGHILPPGYFMSRFYAQGTMENYGLLKSDDETRGSHEFDAAWDLAFLDMILKFRIHPDPYEYNILMGGIDNYTEPFSFHSSKKMYSANIEDFWAATQTMNNVAVPAPCCLYAIWNSDQDLFIPARDEYMKRPPAPVTYKIVAFGHTHHPMLEVYPAGNAYTSIYANSGSWVDKFQTSHDVRTYLVITPSAWSGSAIDVVSLYQYNLEPGSGSPGSDFGYELLAEESIEAGI